MELDKDNHNESYIANEKIEEALENDSKVRTHVMANVEAAPMLIKEKPESRQR